MGDQEINGNFDLHAFLSAMPYDQWISVHPSGWCPPARYKHAAEVVDEKLYIIGGSRNGRYISDVQVFDLRNLKWSSLELKRDPDTSNVEDITLEEVFPACASHSLVKWEGKLLIVGGNLKKSSDTVTVWSINLETHACNVVNTSGRVPTARGGQTVTLVGSRLIMFGGEDSRRRLLNDLHILDLETMTWDAVQTKKTSPAPRFDHTATVHADQYLLIFGGSSHSVCFHDLHVLDLQTMEWSQPEIHGSGVSPRGGHAGTVIDESWYIVGGGDNRSGATETLLLNMSKLVWSIITTVKERDALASEGLTLCSTTVDGEKLLIAFGGYNGKYNNEVYILRPKPRDSAQPRLFQSAAAAAAAASVSSAYALIKNGNVLNKGDGNIKKTLDESSPKAIAVDTAAIGAEKRILESRLVEVRAENSTLKNNLNEINDSHAELSMELQSVQGQLEAEKSRCLKLELQIAEMRKRLESLNSIEQELEVLRLQKSQVEQAMASTEEQKSGGVWRWATGSTQN